MAELNKHKEQIKDTGCSYGYFTLTKAKEQDTEAFLNCEIPLKIDEYELAKSELEKLTSISNLTEIILDFEDAQSELTMSINAIDQNDRKSMKAAQAATEHFVESVVRTVTHYKRQLHTAYGDCVAKSFDKEISEIYDNGNAYALLYKLRNIYQHEGAIPLKLSRNFGKDGIVKTSIILNSTKMLDGHIASYLNAKVKIFITSNPEPDVHALAKEVFDQLSELMQNFIETKLIDTEFAKTGSSYIDLFLKLDKPCDVLFLTKMKEITDSGSRGINMMQTQITLEYLCKLLSVYLSNRPEVLFSYWGQSLGKKAKELLPGLQDVLGPKYFSSRDPIRIAGVQYSCQKGTLALAQPTPEVCCMLYRDDTTPPAVEKLDLYWDLFEKLIKGLKALTNINTAAQKESVLAGEDTVTDKS